MLMVKCPECGHENTASIQMPPETLSADANVPGNEQPCENCHASIPLSNENLYYK